MVHDGFTFQDLNDDPKAPLAKAVLVPELASGEVLDSSACRQKKVSLEFKPTDRGCHGAQGVPKESQWPLPRWLCLLFNDYKLRKNWGL
jgi:hypothetical protein